MSLISEDTQYNKLRKLHINIKTKYITGNKILERNTDNSYNDDILDGIRCKKEYYLNDKLVHTENKFDSRITYTFISKEMENMENLLDAQIFPDADTHRKSNRNNKRGMLIWEFFQNRKLLF